jgi:nuclease-like protein
LSPAHRDAERDSAVRIIELSNHPADALRLAITHGKHAGGQGRTGRTARADVTDELARHELFVRRAISARDRARAQRHWLAWARAALAVSRLRRLAPPQPQDAGAGRGAGDIPRLDGERQVVADFGAVLADDWVLVRGYCNQRGEIDYLLLGPTGLVAMQTRHLNATVTCDGDKWLVTTTDGHGKDGNSKMAERGAFTDGRGRSPSVQLNEPADLLEQLLSSHCGKVSVLRVVLLTHQDAKLGRCENATVRITTSARELAFQLADMPPVIGAVQRARLEELIARDRRYRERDGARTGRSARSASTRSESVPRPRSRRRTGRPRGSRLLRRRPSRPAG